jgi:hypothetical protein
MTSLTWLSARWRYFIAALFTASVLVLTACNGGSNPPGNDPSSASASGAASISATPSPTPTPSAVYKPADANGKAQNVPVPVLPEAAKAETKEGLEAFARYWYELMNYAYETGNLAPVSAVSGSNCASCSKVRDTIIAWNSDGQWIEGGALIVQSADTKYVRDPSGNYQVVVQYRRQAIAYHLADGSVEESSPKTSLLADIVIAKYTSGRWTAINVDKIGG